MERQEEHCRNGLFTAPSTHRKESGHNPLEILQRAVDNAKPRLEIKARRVGGATYQVPLEVPTDRQFALWRCAGWWISPMRGKAPP